MTGSLEAGSSRALFGRDYAEARAIFLAAAKAAHAGVSSYEHPLRGPSGELLAMDIAFLGEPDADELLIVSSGVHGVEGFCGSACQAALLRSGVFTAGRNTAVLLAHAINPYGFAHLRRTNEDNIDVNRNFVDHSRPPENSGYAELHELLLPGDWDGPCHLEAERALFARMAKAGVRNVYATASRGQYDHPGGLFYGGSQPCWSNQTWHEILRHFAPNRSRIVHVDLHSGLGEYGFGEIIYVGARDTAGYASLTQWLSEPVSPIADDGAVAPEVEGPLVSALLSVAPDAELILAAIEFGTLNLPPVLRAMRADAWLNTRPETAASTARAMRAEVRSAFYVDEDAWREAVIDQALRNGRELFVGMEVAPAVRRLLQHHRA